LLVASNAAFVVRTGICVKALQLAPVGVAEALGMQQLNATSGLEIEAQPVDVPKLNP
jgi:hypothetical protein